MSVKCICAIIYFIVVARTITVGSNRGSATIQLKLCHPKYLINCSVVTFFKMVDNENRSFVNISFIPLVPVDNSIKVIASFKNQAKTRFRTEHKFCSYYKQEWLKAYLNLTKVTCPLPAGKMVQANNLEIPPRRLMVPLQPGVYEMEGEVFGKERIMWAHSTFTIPTKLNKNKKG